MKCSAFLALAASALALPGAAGAGVSVWFVADGKPVPVVRSGTTIESAVRQLLAGPTPAEREPRRPLGRAPRHAAPLGHRLAAASSPSISERASPPAATSRLSRAGSASSSAPSGASPASAPFGCSSTAASPSASSPATTSAGPSPPPSSRCSAAGDDPRLPAAARRPRLHGAVGAHRHVRHADLDGRARLPEMGGPLAGRHARRVDGRGPASGRRGRSRGSARPAAGSRCSCGGSSRS